MHSSWIVDHGNLVHLFSRVQKTLIFELSTLGTVSLGWTSLKVILYCPAPPPRPSKKKKNIWSVLQKSEHPYERQKQSVKEILASILIGSTIPYPFRKSWNHYKNIRHFRLTVQIYLYKGLWVVLWYTTRKPLTVVMPVLCLDSHKLINACHSAHLCTQCTWNVQRNASGTASILKMIWPTQKGMRLAI